MVYQSTIQILDDIATEEIPVCVVNATDNIWSGNILHEDYQRPMHLNFSNTALTGAILTKDCDYWNKLFSDYSDLQYVTGDNGMYVNTADKKDTASNYFAVDPSLIQLALCF